MFKLLLITFCAVGSVVSLHLEDAEEGSCRAVHYHPLDHVDLDFADTLKYVPAASRYHLYRTASGHPHFNKMREFELYYNMCLTRNASYSSGLGMAIGFGGRVLQSFNMRSRRNEHGVVDSTPIGSGGRRNGVTQTMTLTDHKSFIFVASCWTGTDQRSWDVISNTPVLSETAKKMIEKHAVSLGFDREEIVFLNYNNCGKDIDDDSHSKHDGSYGDRHSPKNSSNNFKRASDGRGSTGASSIRATVTSEGKGWSKEAQ